MDLKSGSTIKLEVFMKKFITKLLLILASVFVVPSYVNAEEYACVTIQGGSGFSARMQIVAGGYSTPWSGTFDVAQTHCQSPASKVAVGAHYTVRIQAVILGTEVDCSPTIKYAGGAGSLLWLASGNGASGITCKAPT